PEWRGGYYYAAKPKTDPNAPLGLLYVSRWSNPDSAAAFAGIYAHSLKQRYKKADEVGGSESSAPQPEGRAQEEAQPSPVKGRRAQSSIDVLVRAFLPALPTLVPSSILVQGFRSPPPDDLLTEYRRWMVSPRNRQLTRS